MSPKQTSKTAPGEQLLVLAADVIVEELKGEPRKQQLRALVGLRDRHSEVRKFVAAALTAARDADRKAKERGKLSQQIAGIKKLPGELSQLLPRIVAGGVATVIVSRRPSSAQKVVALLEVCARENADSIEANVWLAALEAATRACRVGFDVRATSYVAVLAPTAFIVDYIAGVFDTPLCIAMNRPGSPLLDYLLVGQDSKQNTPQRVVSLALSKLGFANSEIHHALKIDRAQVRRLVKPVLSDASS